MMSCWTANAGGSVMRVVTWNMALNSKRFTPRHPDAWRHLTDRLRPDIAFVQEATVPDWVRDRYCVVAPRPPANRGWGSAIVSRLDLEPLVESDDGLVGRFGSRVAMASAEVETVGRVFLASVHLS